MFAVSRWFLGDTDPDGAPDMANGWKQHGYDLDFTATGAESRLTCQPLTSAPQQLFDGDEGIDNSFGRNFLPILLGLNPDYSEELSAQVATGAPTLVIQVDGLGPDADYFPVPSRVYRAVATSEPPLWEGSDVRLVAPDTLVDPADLTSARVVFPGAYVTEDTWVAPAGATIELQLPIGADTLVITIHQAIITMELDPDRTGATKGVIAGILGRDEAIEEVRRMIASAFGADLCTGAIDSVLTSLRQTADIHLDGRDDPTTQCDGISIGLGFDATRVTLGGVGGARPPLASPCD